MNNHSNISYEILSSVHFFQFELERLYYTFISIACWISSSVNTRKSASSSSSPAWPQFCILPHEMVITSIQFGVLIPVTTKDFCTRTRLSLRLFTATTIQSTICCFPGPFTLALVSLLTRVTSSRMCRIHFVRTTALNGLLILTSKGCSFYVQPPGMTASVPPAFLVSFLIVSVRWALKLSRTSRAGCLLVYLRKYWSTESFITHWAKVANFASKRYLYFWCLFQVKKPKIDTF